jgi:hypothetical protein
MRLPIFIVLLAAALVGTAAALRLATRVRDQQGVSFATGLSAGTLVLWLLVTVSAFNVVSVSNGAELANSYPSLGVLGVLGVGVSTLILGKGSLELLNP